MIENNTTPDAFLGRGSTSMLPSGNAPPHMMVGRGRGQGEVGEYSGRAPMKEYMDRVADKRKWEDVSLKRTSV